MPIEFSIWICIICAETGILITVTNFLKGEGEYYAKKHSDRLSSIESLAWHAASDLAAFIEMTLEPEDLPKAIPKTWVVLFGLEAYFKERKELLSESHALVMLLIEREQRGLEPRGNDSKRTRRAT